MLEQLLSHKIYVRPILCCAEFPNNRLRQKVNLFFEGSDLEINFPKHTYYVKINELYHRVGYRIFNCARL